MVTFERILCAVDLSDASRRALLCALGLARECHAEMRVVHVADLGRWLPGAFVETLPPADVLATVKEHLDWWVARSLGAGDGAVTDVREGSVVAGILEAAESMRADLVVVGSHGRAGFDRLGPGSAAERLVWQAPCAVLVVPARTTAVVRSGAPGRVVCAVDAFRPRSRALACAHLMAEGGPVPLSLVSVIDWPSGGGAAPLASLPLPADVDKELGERLHDMAARAGIAAPVAVAVRHGRVGPEILAHARETSAELIVLGAAERSSFGPTIHHVLREAPCPILVVPDGANPGED